MEICDDIQMQILVSRMSEAANQEIGGVSHIVRMTARMGQDSYSF